MSHDVGKEIGDRRWEWEPKTAGSTSSLLGSATPHVLMGDLSRSVRSSGLRLLVRLVSVVAALVVLSITQKASAAMVAVGMCGERNETIEAPPIFRAVNDDGTIGSAPCRAPSDTFTNGGTPLTPERVIVYERPERVVGFASLLVAQSESARMPVVGAALVPALPGFVDTLFRPPRG